MNSIKQSSWQIFKNTCQFILDHWDRGIALIAGFYFISYIYSVVNQIALRIKSIESFTALKNSIGSGYNMLFWEMWVSVLSIFVIVFIATYFLTKIRHEKVDLSRAFKSSFKAMINAWKVVLGICMITVPIAVIMGWSIAEGNLSNMIGISIAGGLLGIVEAFMGYFIADGETEFFKTLGKSCRYMGTLWKKLVGLGFIGFAIFTLNIFFCVIIAKLAQGEAISLPFAFLALVLVNAAASLCALAVFVAQLRLYNGLRNG